MLNDIYIYENRDLIYLKLYERKARRLSLNITVLGPDRLKGNARYEKFLSLYEHYSVNSFGFEVSCFARYFAIAEAHKSEDAFILSDSDIYLVNNLQHIREDTSLQGIFIGSEGFYGEGSEHQISPHFSFWNKALINSFTDYLLETYERNKQDHFLARHYEMQQEKIGRTAISDMTLLYMWVKEKGIPYLNSNAIGNSLGIDHNISAVYSENGVYQSFGDRKAITLKGETVYCRSIDGRVQPMSVLHFQGEYKWVLKYFYQGSLARFYWFTVSRALKRGLKPGK